MYKTVYKVMSSIILLALTLGSYSNAGASSTNAPQVPATTYYVAVTGNDVNAGASSTPFKTIQKCLNQVKPGDTCIVAAGTYNEALTLKTSGAISAPITVKCATNKGCTVNSSTNLTLITGGRIHYYTLDGFRFIYSGSGGYSMRLGENIWDGETSKDGGNNGFVIRNCYIEGAVMIYGHNNLIESCEFNGKGVYGNGIFERFAASHDNTYRNNTIYNYTVRGIWSMQRTDNIVIDGNNIYNIRSGGIGIDCDGAANNQTRCHIRNNVIHDSAIVGILYENCFDCTASGNTIYNVREAIGAINYGPSYTTDKKEYRSTDTRLLINNNVIYNTSSNGIGCYGSPGGTAINNTIYKSNQSTNWFGAFGFSQTEGFYCHNWVIKNNLISQPKAFGLFFESGAAGLSKVVSDDNFFDFGVSDKKFTLKKAGVDTNYTFAQWQGLGRDTRSKLNSTPLFINPSAANFRLQSGSPACGYGAFPCGNVVSNVTVTNTNTPVIVSSATPSPTAISTFQTSTLTAVITATKLPISATPTVSAVPVLPTKTSTSVPSSPVPTASAVPVLPTKTSTSVPSSPAPIASAVQVLPAKTSTSVPPSPAPTASAVPVLPTISISSTAVVEEEQLPISGTVYDDNDIAFIYSPDWKEVDKERAHGDSYKQTTKNGSFVTFTFTGQSFSVLYTAGPALRKVDVYVDDILVGTINEKGKPEFQKSWDYTGQLASGTHILRLVFVTNNKFGKTGATLDAVIVR